MAPLSSGVGGSYPVPSEFTTKMNFHCVVLGNAPYGRPPVSYLVLASVVLYIQTVSIYNLLKQAPQRTIHLTLLPTSWLKATSRTSYSLRTYRFCVGTSRKSRQNPNRKKSGRNLTASRYPISSIFCELAQKSYKSKHGVGRLAFFLSRPTVSSEYPVTTAGILCSGLLSPSIRFWMPPRRLIRSPPPKSYKSPVFLAPQCSRRKATTLSGLRYEKALCWQITYCCTVFRCVRISIRGLVRRSVGWSVRR